MYALWVLTMGAASVQQGCVSYLHLYTCINAVSDVQVVHGDVGGGDANDDDDDDDDDDDGVGDCDGDCDFDDDCDSDI